MTRDRTNVPCPPLHERRLPSVGAALDPGAWSDLERDHSTIYALDGDLRLAYLNPGWFRFAAANGGDEVLRRFKVGALITDAIAPAIRDHYERGYRWVLHSGRVWEHRYECPSPEAQRMLWMRVFPLPGVGTLAIHALEHVAPHDAASPLARAEALATFTDARGLVAQCSHCRRVRHPGFPDRWDFVPSLLTPTENTSHGLCAPCAAMYYPAPPA